MALCNYSDKIKDIVKTISMKNLLKRYVFSIKI